MTDTEFYEQLQAFVGRDAGPDRFAPDEVNLPMIRHMTETLGDRNPVYTDAAAAAQSVHGQIIAPATMLQAWVMAPFGTNPSGDGTSAYDHMNDLLFSRGFTSVVATNCEQQYHRMLHLGDKLRMRAVIDSISPEKATGLGVGHFITTRQDYFDQNDELVASMLFRIIRFRPPAAAETPAARPARPPASTTPDTDFFFESLKQDRIQVQRCSSCSTLRHPPGPMCATCHSLEWEPVDIAGTGVIHSFIVVHYPQVPAFEYPLPVVLVDLTGPGEDGLRMVMNIRGAAPEDVQIGQAVRIDVTDVGNDTKLPIATVGPDGSGG